MATAAVANKAEYWRVEAERLRADNDRLRVEAERWRVEAMHQRDESARSAAEISALKTWGSDLEGQVAALTEQVATLSKMLFGQSSEKKPHRPEPDATDGESSGGDTGGSKKSKRGQRRGEPGHGRRDYSHLDSEERIHEVDPDERVCSECGLDYEACGFEDAFQIDWVVRLIRIVHRRRKYQRKCDCATSKSMVVAPVPPKAIPKSMFTSMFLARLIDEKYVHGRPMNRIVASLAGNGFDVAPGTLVGVMKKLSPLLEPLDAAIQERNAAAGRLHVDETSWNVFEPVAGKANKRWWLWVFVAPDTTVFEIAKSRSTRVLADHLGINLDAKSLPEGRELVLSSDFFSVYQSVGKIDGIISLWCWAHMRRYFIRAGAAHPELIQWAATWLERIATIYANRWALITCEIGTAEHADAHSKFVDTFDTIDAQRLTESADETLHPRARKVLATFGNEWEGLARHKHYPEIPLDNNVAERAARNPAVCRKVFYGSGSVWSSVLAGRVWTISATAAQAGINPLGYLYDYFETCASNGGRPLEGEMLERFLPWNASPEDLQKWGTGPEPTPTASPP